MALCIHNQVEDTNFDVEAEIKDWSCKRCTLTNSGDLSICQACGGSKMKSLEQKKEYWTCPKCTLRNPGSVHKCRVCENLRKLPSNPKINSTTSSSSMSTSICAVCTYDNAPGRKKCEMCNANLQIVTTTTTTPANNTSKLIDTSLTSRPGSTTSMGSRHESELMEQLRKVEESAAKDKWRNIVQFCKENRLTFVDDEFAPSPKSLFYTPSDSGNHQVIYI